MKNIISILLLIVFNTAFAQVIFGDDIGTATDKTSVLLDFPKGQNKGIILPYVKKLPSGLQLGQGTIVLDATNPTKAKVKFYKGLGNWVDLSSGNGADITAELAVQPNVADEDCCGKVIIGARTSAFDGVLILESPNKAMVLPMVLDTDDIINPSPGMMVYVNKTGAKRLAVFNGAVWTYWKS